MESKSEDKTTIWIKLKGKSNEQGLIPPALLLV